MAGIKVKQHKIFKIGTTHLKKNGWNLELTEKEASSLDEEIRLFDSQLFRIATLIVDKDSSLADLKKDGNIVWNKCFVSIVIDGKRDFNRVFKGFTLNNEEFVRFVGTTGGLKNNSIIFANKRLIDDLNNTIESVDIKRKMVPAKYEAYKALTLSSSFPISNPKGVLVVKDAIIKYMDDIIYIDDSDEKKEPTVTSMKNVELENNATDGFNLCTIDYMERVCVELGLDYISGGLCLRNKWLKGMMYPFPIMEFIEKYNNGNFIIKDIWENDIDMREVELILTESSLKLWSSYNSIDSYLENCKENGYTFSVTKISPNKLDNKELNYQYLQSYDFSEDDIIKLCEPTVNKLKKSMGKEYKSVLGFLGVAKDGIEKGTWQHALVLNEIMLKDPYVIDNIHRLIKKKINNAKIGKLKCNANFQTFSNDPFVFMQSVCGLELTGILNKNECYSSYWVDKKVYEILSFRSPMSVHNNIRKLSVIDNEEARFWYKYMKNIFIVNSFDSFCKAENGEDCDGDANFTTDNKILIRNFKQLDAIVCSQRNAKKVDITQDALRDSNLLAFGNNVGEITNYITSMKEVQSQFSENSDEYLKIENRMMCGQLYQQNCIDAIKGIISNPMPKSWHSRRSCGDDTFNLSICANKKPYFMIYRYSNERTKYKKYIEENYHKCVKLFKITLSELLAMDKDNMSDEQRNFVDWYYKKMPVGINNCSMNKICYYIENSLDGVKSELKQNSSFDYTFLKYKKNDNKLEREKLVALRSEYIAKIASFKSTTTTNTDKESFMDSRKLLKEHYYNLARDICSDEKRLLNMVLDISYGEKGNKQFCWDIVGDLICNRLEELELEKTNNE